MAMHPGGIDVDTLRRLLVLATIPLTLQACGHDPEPPIVDPAKGGSVDLLPRPILARHVRGDAEIATSDSKWRVVAARSLGHRLTSRAGGRSRSSAGGSFFLVRFRVRNTSVQSLRISTLPVLAFDDGSTGPIPDGADYLPTGEPAPSVEALEPNAERELSLVYEVPRRRSTRAIAIPSLSLAGVGGHVDL